MIKAVFHFFVSHLAVAHFMQQHNNPAKCSRQRGVNQSMKYERLAKRHIPRSVQAHFSVDAPDRSPVTASMAVIK